MSFKGLDFIFDGYHSDLYGLKIMSINGNNVTESSGGCGIEIFEDRVYRNPSAYHQGVAQNEPLEFDIEFVSEDEIVGVLRSKIGKWLFGRMQYKKLQIVQNDLQDIYFNCHLINPTYTYIGNCCHGISCTVRCDAPWAWQMEKTYSIIPNEGDLSEDKEYNYTHYNDSDDTDYTYPIISFQMRKDGTFKVENETDNRRTLILENLLAGEEIEIDCRNQIITSSKNRLLSENFNKVFFRLISSMNVINITGDFIYFQMKYCNARKVGG